MGVTHCASAPRYGNRSYGIVVAFGLEARPAGAASKKHTTLNASIIDNCAPPSPELIRHPGWHAAQDCRAHHDAIVARRTTFTWYQGSARGIAGRIQGSAERRKTPRPCSNQTGLGFRSPAGPIHRSGCWIDGAGAGGRPATSSPVGIRVRVLVTGHVKAMPEGFLSTHFRPGKARDHCAAGCAPGQFRITGSGAPVDSA